MPVQRPHIIFIYGDQHRFDCVGVNGHPLLRTPNLDRIAREGANFTRAFTPSPICVPARCSLLSGRWPTQHGTIHNFDGETFTPMPPTDSAPIRAVVHAGYHGIHLGRWHVRPDMGATDFGFHRYIPDWRYVKVREKLGLGPVPSDRGWIGQADVGTPEQGPLGWASDQAIRVIEQQLEESDRLFLHWHFVEPHFVCHPPEPFASMYDPKALAPWASFADQLVNKPAIQRRIRDRHPAAKAPWEAWAPAVAIYLGTISYVDWAVGRVLDALDRLGIADDTLVVYTADHGDLMAGHKMFDKHHVMYDETTQVPMMLRWPRRVKPGTVVDSFVSNAIDCSATFCEAAGARIPANCAGKSLLPLLDGQPGRGDIFSQLAGNQHGSYTQRMIRDARWKYVWNVSDMDELYDVVADPGEVQNRIDDPACAAELARLRRRLGQWMEEVKDPIRVGLPREWRP
jgi:arylsulfatase A-like enzyme